jgi:nicotinamide-nucleotide amidase
MRVEVINTGTELLLGSVLNTHLRFLAEALFPLGLRVNRQVTVPDGPDIRTALLESFARAEIVIVTGGLGPTTDDITREVTAELLGLTLVHDEEVMQAIAKRFARRGLTMGVRIARQAQRPAEAVVLANEFGTAPGLYLPAFAHPAGKMPAGAGGTPTLPETIGPSALPGTPHLFLLPGPPRELQPMFEAAAVPILRALVPPREAHMRTWRISGLGESSVEELVGEPLLALGVELGYCARPGEVDLRTIGTEAQLAQAAAIVEAALAPHIVSPDATPLEAVIVQELTARRETLAVAESCTGGFVAHRITNVPGASAVFLAGFVTYANEAKQALGVDPQLIAEHGAVSSQVAAAMASGARAAAGATFALSTTGIAGPGGGTKEKPVGTVYIALAEEGREPRVELHKYPTDRATFKDLTSQAALDLLRRRLREG